MEQESAQKKFDSLAGWLLCGQIIGATYLQKISVPAGGNTKLYFSVFLILALTTVGVATSRLAVQKYQFLFFLIMLGGITLTQLLGQSDPSLLSFLFLVLVHIPYIFTLRQGLSRPNMELEFFQKTMVIIAIFGIIQYPLQFIINPDYAFFLDAIFFKQLIMSGFHGLNPMHYGSHIYKSNGFFMLEPAMFCQFLAIAIVIEISYFKNWWRLCTYILAVALTFSGTGLIILFLIMPFYLLHKRQFLLLAFLLFMVVAAPIWAPMIGLEGLVNRASEITNPHSSGYARFISMFPFLNATILPELDTFLFGRGAGSIPWDGGLLSHVDYELFNPSWAKIFFEYGLIGFLFYFSFMFYFLFKSCKSSYIKSALAIQFLILGEYVLPPTVHGLILGLLVWPSVHEKIEESV